MWYEMREEDRGDKAIPLIQSSPSNCRSDTQMEGMELLVGVAADELPGVVDPDVDSMESRIPNPPFDQRHPWEQAD